MFEFITVLIFIVCIALVLFVLVQNSKGGGLSSSFSSSNSVMGVRKTTDFLEKATWYMAAALLILCFASSAFINRDKVSTKSAIESQINNLEDPNAVPMFPEANPQPETETEAQPEAN